MIFETFCRIHQCISIEMLAQKLNMKPTEAERWIVNLIRQAKLDAKIDSQQGKLKFRLGTIHLRRRHALGGEGSKICQICRRIVLKNCRR